MRIDKQTLLFHDLSDEEAEQLFVVADGCALRGKFIEIPLSRSLESAWLVAASASFVEKAFHSLVLHYRRKARQARREVG